MVTAAGLATGARALCTRQRVRLGWRNKADEEEMTTPHPKSSLYRPSAFAWAVASLMTLDDTDEEAAVGTVHLGKPASAGWRAWTRATDWRVDEGDTLFNNFEVCDGDLGVPRSRALRPVAHSSPARQAWAEGKAEQLDKLMQQLHADEPPLQRWIAAMVDVLPLTELGKGVEFRRSLLRDDVALTTSTVVVSVCRADTATGWTLRLEKRIGGESTVSQVPPADQPEHQCIYDLLSAGWVPGMPRNRWDS